MQSRRMGQRNSVLSSLLPNCWISCWSSKLKSSRCTWCNFVLRHSLLTLTIAPRSHQWIFITDTVDAIYRPDDCEPEALLDRLAEVVGDLPAAEVSKHHIIAPRIPDIYVASPQSTNHLDHGVPATPTMNDPRGRKPMLQGVRSIDSIRDLGRFFSHASIASYESVYNSGGNIDWEAVEQGLLEDMFDGR